MKKPVGILRIVALIEGVSLLILIGIAMPLKYLAGLPLAVKWVGWIHGALFIVFCAALCWTVLRVKWPWARSALVFAAALVPLGPFLLDRRMRVYEGEAGRRRLQPPATD
jgi:integral membrane protein